MVLAMQMAALQRLRLIVQGAHIPQVRPHLGRSPTLLVGAW